MDVRCPVCGAMVRPSSDWCTLCHADLRPASLVPLESELAEAAAAAPIEPTYDPLIDPLTAPLDQISLESYSADSYAAAALPPDEAPRRGKHARVEPEQLSLAGFAAPTDFDQALAASPTIDREIDDEDLFAGIGDPDVLFSQLRAEGRDPILARFGGIASEPSTKLMVMAGGMLAVSVLLVGVFSLIGLVFN